MPNLVGIDDGDHALRCKLGDCDDCCAADESVIGGEGAEDVTDGERKQKSFLLLKRPEKGRAELLQVDYDGSKGHSRIRRLLVCDFDGLWNACGAGSEENHHRLLICSGERGWHDGRQKPAVVARCLAFDFLLRVIGRLRGFVIPRLRLTGLKALLPIGEMGEERSLRVSLSLLTLLSRFFWLESLTRVAGLKCFDLPLPRTHGLAGLFLGMAEPLPIFSEQRTSSMHFTCLIRPPPRIIAFRFTSSACRMRGVVRNGPSA